jgi:cytosine/adenosine deaminase-related metal-dependent hydrolase
MVSPFYVLHADWLGSQDSIPKALQLQKPDVDLIDVGPVLSFPGLVNSHDHLDFNCYSPMGNASHADFLDWSADIHRDHKDTITAVEAIPRAVRLKIGALKNLLSGVTSVAHHGPKLPPDLHLPIRVISDFDSVHSPELEPGGRWEFFKPWRGKPLVIHMAEATTPESRERALDFIRWNVFGRTLIGVHGVALQKEDFSRLDALVWCPASNLFLLGRTADIACAKEATTILFGTDSTISAEGTIWDHLRTARAHGGLSDTELFKSITDDAGRAWRMQNGDFVIARQRERDRWAAFFAITPADIMLVVSNGEVVMADDEIVRASPPIGAQLASLDLGGSRKWVRMDIESLEAGFEASACYLDFANTMRRLTGGA